MTDEQRKEIVKAVFYGHTSAEIAEVEEVSERRSKFHYCMGLNEHKAELEERQREADFNVKRY